MSGHSKWENIKRKKGATDAARAKIFTKIGREIAVVVKQGGADPAGNAKLRDLIAKAKSNNVPNDNIDRIIKKAAGDGDKNSYESMVYEGYGPSGVAVIVECLTDNKNRTAGDIRHFFDKFGGNMGTSGCVSFMFSDVGTVVMENNGADEDKIMEDCFEAGADDFGGRGARKERPHRQEASGEESGGGRRSGVEADGKASRAADCRGSGRKAPDRRAEPRRREEAEPRGA